MGRIIWGRDISLKKQTGEGWAVRGDRCLGPRAALGVTGTAGGCGGAPPSHGKEAAFGLGGRDGLMQSERSISHRKEESLKVWTKEREGRCRGKKNNFPGNGVCNEKVKTVLGSTVTATRH